MRMPRLSPWLMGLSLFGACSNGTTRSGPAAEAGAAGAGGSVSPPAGTGGAPAPGGMGGAPGADGAASGDKKDGAAPKDAPARDAYASFDIAPAYDITVPASGKGIIHSSPYAIWDITDVALYQAKKANMEEIMDVLDHGIVALQARLQLPFKWPIKVHISAGGCCSGFAGGGEVGYSEGSFATGMGMYWIRGVIIGEVVNALTGTVSSGWPSDWWVNSVWYFPGFTVVDVLREVAPTHAVEWQTGEKYDKFGISVLFEQLRAEKGWQFYRDLFTALKTDKMDWTKLTNPSPLLTNYVVAYFGIVSGENMTDRFATAFSDPDNKARVNGLDKTVVQAIMDAHAKLVEAGKAGKNTAAGFAAFRTGNYMAATQGL
jgi:hypothetical protein